MACTAGFGLYNLMQGMGNIIYTNHKIWDCTIIFVSLLFSFQYTNLHYRKVHLSIQGTHYDGTLLQNVFEYMHLSDSNKYMEEMMFGNVFLGIKFEMDFKTRVKKFRFYFLYPYIRLPI
jgi:hypothetical protein